MPAPTAADRLRDDLVSALTNLGYHRQAIDKVLDKLLSNADAATFEDVLPSVAQRTLACLIVSNDRLVTPSRVEDDAQYEAGLRPRRLDDYIGQDRVRENLEVSIAAARQRGEALDHVLLYGPPGLGKTTLAYVIANELGVAARTTSGPVIEKPGDLAGILSNLQAREVLFIDEIHRLPPAIEEILYPAMEDFELDIVIGQGPGARSVKVPVEPFTLVGATTRAGLLTAPLRARFGIVHRLDFYNVADIEEIVRRSARILDVAAGRRRGDGDCAAVARHAAHCQPPAAARARLRAGSRRRADHARSRGGGDEAARSRRSTASTKSIGGCC